jgi:hypothetical protein
MIAAVERQAPDMAIHLGDCWQDGERLRMAFPQLPMEQVNGNCDRFPQGVWEKHILVGSKTALICHGHTYRVKSGYGAAVSAAQKAGVDLLLFGHTHRAAVERIGSLHLMNPGSVGDRLQGSYGMILIDSQGGVECRIMPNEREE